MTWTITWTQYSIPEKKSDTKKKQNVKDEVLFWYIDSPKFIPS